MEEEFISTRNFLKSLAGAFDHDSEGVVRFVPNLYLTIQNNVL